MYACFVDYEKAFDKVDRLHLWIDLSNSKSGKKCYVVANLFAKAKAFVLMVNCLSHSFVTLSPLLFAIYLSDLNAFIPEHFEGLQLVPALASEFIIDVILFKHL